jgi:hypothetical protein
LIAVETLGRVDAPRAIAAAQASADMLKARTAMESGVIG